MRYSFVMIFAQVIQTLGAFFTFAELVHLAAAATCFKCIHDAHIVTALTAHVPAEGRVVSQNLQRARLFDIRVSVYTVARIPSCFFNVLSPV